MTAEVEGRLQSAAYHEAGHAVVAYLQRQRFTEVLVLPSGEDLGGIHIGDWIRESVEDWLYTILAGAIAEGLFRGEEDWRGAFSDMEQALDLATVACNDDREEAVAYLLVLTYWVRNYVRDPNRWAAIEGVAAELIQKHRLAYSQVGKIVSAVGSGKPYRAEHRAETDGNTHRVGGWDLPAINEHLAEGIPSRCREPLQCAAKIGRLMTKARQPLELMAGLLLKETCPTFAIMHHVFGLRGWYEEIEEEARRHREARGKGVLSDLRRWWMLHYG